jgi:hypothetical protein
MLINHCPIILEKIFSARVVWHNFSKEVFMSVHCAKNRRMAAMPLLLLTEKITFIYNICNSLIIFQSMKNFIFYYTVTKRTVFTDC